MDALTEATIEASSRTALSAQIYPVLLGGDVAVCDRLPLPAGIAADFNLGSDGTDAGDGWLSAPVIVCDRASAPEVVDGLTARGIAPHTVVAVPCADGPARALTAAALLLIATDPDAIMLACTDAVPDCNRIGLRRTIADAAAEAQRGTFVHFTSPGDAGTGIFMVSARRFLQEIELSAAKVLDACADAVALAVRRDSVLYLARPSYETAPSLAFDVAAMACEAGVAVFPLPGRDDAGTEANPSPTSTIERAFQATSGAESAGTGDGEDTVRPWGTFKSVNRGDRFQVKQIVVKPGARLSLQMHHHRSEHWIVVAGMARIVCGEEERLLYENEHAFIRPGEKHRLENPGKVPLQVIEVQSGAYLGEDDIVRFDDIYGRIHS